jgi:hypothetical protein
LYRNVMTDVQRVRARDRSIRSSESALEATETGYEVGTRNIVEVLQAQQRLYQAQFDYADSRYNYVLNMLRLLQSAGILGDEHLAYINDYIEPDEGRAATWRANSYERGIDIVSEPIDLAWPREPPLALLSPGYPAVPGSPSARHLTRQAVTESNCQQTLASTTLFASTTLCSASAPSWWRQTPDRQPTAERPQSNAWHQAAAPGSLHRQRASPHLAKLKSCGPIMHRHTDQGRLDWVVAADGNQAATDKSHIGQRVELQQLAHGVADQHFQRPLAQGLLTTPGSQNPVARAKRPVSAKRSGCRGTRMSTASGTRCRNCPMGIQHRLVFAIMRARRDPDRAASPQVSRSAATRCA